MQSNAIGSSYNSNFTRAILWCCWNPCRNNDLPNSSSKKSIDETCDNIIKIALRCRSHNIATIFLSRTAYSTKVDLQLIHNLNCLLYNACTKYGFNFIDNDAVTSGKMPLLVGNFLAKWLLQVTLLAALFFREYDSTH